MDAQKFIQLVAGGEASQAKDMLNDLLSARAFESLDTKKQEIAQALYNNGENIEVQDTADSEDEELLTQEEFDALSEEDQELYLETLEQLDEISGGYEVKQSKTDSDVHHVHYNGKKIGSVYGNKKGMWGHEYHPMGTGDDGYSSKREAVNAVKDDHLHHLNMKEEFDELSEENKNLYMEMLDSVETQLREIGLLDEEQLDEISNTAAKNYLHKALPSSSKLNQKSAKPGEKAAEKYNYSYENAPYETKEFKKFSKRRTGIRKAINKLASAHPENEKHAKVARQAFNSIYSDNYRVGMHKPGFGQSVDKERENIRNAHKIVKTAVNAMHKNAMKEDVEELDEVSQKTAVNAYSARLGREDDDTGNIKSLKTLDRIHKKHGAKGVMRAATAADKEYGIHNSDWTKKDFVGDYLRSKK